MHDARRDGNAPRIALYSHDTMGVGHFRRNLLLAQAFAAPWLAASVLMLSGMREAGRFAMPPHGVDVLTLPGWRKLPTGGYAPRALANGAKAHADLRANVITAALASFRPDLLIVDNVPRGVEGELTSVLHELRRTGTRIVLGLRDILDDAAAVRRQWWRRRNYEAVRRLFDAVWVYGDPRICHTTEEYGFGPDLSARVEHLGYLDPLGRLELAANETPAAAAEPYVLCVAGGGEDGAALTEAFAATAMPHGHRGVIVLGAMAPADVRARVRSAAAARPDITVLDDVSEGMRLMARAARIVCMGGYNTTIEALALAKPALIVPRVAPRREQAIRAERLAALGLVEILEPREVSPSTLAARLARPFRPKPNPLDFGGLDRAVAHAARLIGRPNHTSHIAPERATQPRRPEMTDPRRINRRQPRIGYVLKRYPRFSETFVVHEILAHERSGLAIDIFALRPVAETHFQDVLGRVRSPVVRIPEKMRNAPAFWAQLAEARRRLPSFWKALERSGDTDIDDLSQAVALALEIEARGIEHLHAHFGTVATTVARLAADFTGISYSFTAHAKDIYFRYDEPVNLDVKLRDAAAVVTISEYNLHHLRERFSADAAHTTLIYNGLDHSGLPWREPVPSAREILAVGRLIEKKGFHVLIEAARLLHERGADFTLRIVGAGPEEANLQDQIERSGLRHRAVLDGPRPQSEVIECMRKAALVAAPCVVGEDGNRDGLPTVLLEAMAVGTPCVATDVTGIPELVRDGETGLIAAEGDPDTLADQMERLLGDVDLRRRLSAAGRARIERDFDIDINTRRLRDLFNDAIARRKSALRGAA